MSFNGSRADGGEWGQALFRRMRGPADAAEDQNPEQRIIERPRVMAGNRNENPAGTVLPGPDDRLRLALFEAGGEDVDRRRIARKLPIAFVMDGKAGKTARDRAAFREFKVENAVAEFRLSASPRQTDAFAEGLRGLVTIHRKMQIDQPAAAPLKLVEFQRLGVVPARVIGVENNHIRLA